jgi:hypothetical protein
MKMENTPQNGRPHQEQESTLCNECKLLDLPKIFTPDTPKLGSVVDLSDITVRTVGDFHTSSPYCSFCRLVIKTIGDLSPPPVTRDTICRLRKELSGKIHGITTCHWDTGPSTYYQIRGMVHPSGFLDGDQGDMLSTLPREDLEEQGRRYEKEFVIRSISQSEWQPWALNFMQARRMRGDQVDVELVKEWIRPCQERCEHSRVESGEPIDLGVEL